MSTWISKAGLFALLLSGCVVPPGGTTEVKLGQGEDGGAVSVTGPVGFCVLERTQQRRGQAEFVALTRCGAPVFGSGQPATLTATVGEEGTANGLDLTGPGIASFFTSTEGRRALSRGGRADRVTVHEVTQTSGAVMIRFSEAGATAPQSVWRAMMGLRGRLVTLSVQRQGATELSAEEGRSVMLSFVSAMRRANAG